MSKPTVFISYSHKDEAWKDRLVTHLGVLQQENLLDLWDDRRIGAGEGWYQRIQTAMDQASVAVLLISPDSLTSAFILHEEVTHLLERRDKDGLYIFPIIVRPCAWKQVKWLAQMQVRPKDGRPLSAGTEYQIDADLSAITEGIVPIVSQPRLATGEQRADLFEIASKLSLPPGDLNQIFKASLPPEILTRRETQTLWDTVDSPGQRQRLWTMLDFLWNIPLQPNRRLPVLEFVERLARHTSDQLVAKELRTWTDVIVPHLNLALQPVDIDSMRDELGVEGIQVQAAPSYLLVKITPDRDNRRKKKQLLFSIDVFLWKHEKAIEYWHTDGDDKPRSLPSVPQLLEDLLARHTDAPKIVEFFLPRELISGDIDQWAMTQSVLLPTKLGIEYQVVVRSLDRLTLLGSQFRDRWKIRWKQFRDMSLEAGTKHLLVCHKDEYQPQVLYRTLLRSQDTTCLGLTFVPTELPAREDIFCAIIQAGIPVALWARPCGDAPLNPKDIRMRIDALVSNTALFNLPHVIQRERQQADDQNDATHPGNHWTLLWDDPNRLPPTWLLTSP